MSDLSAVMKAVEAIETKLAAFAAKAEAEYKATGSESTDTKNAIEGLGLKQRELADEIQQLKQRGATMQDEKPGMAPGASSSSAATNTKASSTCWPRA